MNVFVLCTGRCGSVTFSKACQHITNYTAAHESKTDQIGQERLNFASNHIEADNRLSWFLGRLDAKYGQDAFYVHLIRNREDVAKSYYRRWYNNTSIARAYSKHILMSQEKELEQCADFCDTVNTNIEHFLRDKPHQMIFRLENAEEDFKVFWKKIEAKGDLEAALTEWTKKHNPSRSKKLDLSHTFWHKWWKLKRLIKHLPDFIRYT